MAFKESKEINEKLYSKGLVSRPESFNQYSDAELKIISELKFEDFICSSSATPLMLYIAMATRCFIDNRNDNFANAVRAANIALEKGTVFRMTPEWDAMLEKELNR